MYHKANSPCVPELVCSCARRDKHTCLALVCVAIEVMKKMTTTNLVFAFTDLYYFSADCHQNCWLVSLGLILWLNFLQSFAHCKIVWLQVYSEVALHRCLHTEWVLKQKDVINKNKNIGMFQRIGSSLNCQALYCMIIGCL